MPRSNILKPETSAPLDRLALHVNQVRSGVSTATGYVSACNCFADDVEASSMYSPPGMCFADEVEASSMYSGSSVCFADEA